MQLTAEQKRATLRTLAKRNGYPSVIELLKVAAVDNICPAICINEDCDYSSDLESDQEKGWCDECQANTMQSFLIIAGLI